MNRFMRLYCSDINEEEALIEVEKVKISPSVPLTVKEIKNETKFKIDNCYSASIEISSLTDQKNTIKSIIT